MGAGLLGLATARALVRRGWSVEVLEAAPEVGHPRSGSKGGARIFRLGYPDAHYVEMAVMARDLWLELERESGRRLLHPTGQLTLGHEDTLAAISAALHVHGASCEWLTPVATRARFPAIASDGAALVEPQSGVLAADACLQALRVTAACELRTGVRVTALHEDGDGVRIETEHDAVRRADVVVDCAGPGTLGLLGPAGRSAATARGAPPSLPQVAYFAPGAPAVRSHPVPVFIEWDEDMIYGLPVPSSRAVGTVMPEGTVKVSHHTPGAPLERYDPTDPRPLPDDPALLGGLVAAVRRVLPELDPEPIATERCVYDNSADTDFVLDRVGHVVVGCGTSGHGFKFGPLLGELLADLAEGSRPRVDLGPFALRPA